MSILDKLNTEQKKAGKKLKDLYLFLQEQVREKQEQLLTE